MSNVFTFFSFFTARRIFAGRSCLATCLSACQCQLLVVDLLQINRAKSGEQVGHLEWAYDLEGVCPPSRGKTVESLVKSSDIQIKRVKEDLSAQKMNIFLHYVCMYRLTHKPIYLALTATRCSQRLQTSLPVPPPWRTLQNIRVFSDSHSFALVTA